MTSAAQRTVEAVWRIESARLTASLARTVNDVGLAQDLAQDALVAALEQWPESGVPDRPGAWLLAVARRRAVDTVRRRVNLERKLALIARETPGGDDPMDEIARAFLIPSTTLGQRVSRAKRTLSNAQVPFEVPVGDELSARSASVLEVVYLVLNEGYAATSGDSWVRAELCAEAMRLGRMLAALAPDEPEPHGLVALMEFQTSRLRARTDADGRPVPLDRQDRTRWDRLLITHAEGALRRADHLGGRGP